MLFMLTKDNVTIGIEWRFGPDWPGPRCGAKTEEGRARILAANLRHGKFTKDKLERQRENAVKGREIRKELRQMERELIAGGLLDKHWRDSFPS